MGYVAIYRALVQPPPQAVRIVNTPEYAVELAPGPFSIRYQNLSANPVSPANTLDFEYQTRDFDAGSYLIIVVPRMANQPVIGAGWRAAFDVFARVVASLELEFPGIVHEQLYEGTMAFPGVSMFIDRQDGVQLGGRVSYPHGDIAAALPARVEQLGRVPSSDAGRFTLAARWFRRANDAANPIDRVLFYYMVLEVYPTVTGTKVPEAVSELLAQHVYPSLSPKELRGRLDLGRICRFRGEIVHGGKASVETLEEWRIVSGYVERLRAIARTCLRILLGEAPGSDLDRFVLRPHQP